MGTWCKAFLARQVQRQPSDGTIQGSRDTRVGNKTRSRQPRDGNRTRWRRQHDKIKTAKRWQQNKFIKTATRQVVHQDSIKTSSSKQQQDKSSDTATWQNQMTFRSNDITIKWHYDQMTLRSNDIPPNSVAVVQVAVQAVCQRQVR